MGSNPTEFKTYSRQFDARSEMIRQHVAKTEEKLTGNKLTSTKATYGIPTAQYESFFDAYTAALHDAFIDFVVRNPD